MEGFASAEGVFANGSFVRKHNGVGVIKDGVGGVGDFGAGGAGVFGHALKNLGGDDDGFFGFATEGDDAFLGDGNLFGRNVHAEIAAGDHGAVGGLDDFA